jgi:hypothetical protein
VAHVAIQNGRRVKLRYLGPVKNDAALNLGTLLRHGLTRSHGAWILTPA